ncbi:MAG TPA: hypothetical protein VNO70_18365 [Blastocatellia bacterium]|nr:hypothetical protein [Blastocatellia bacterium]
MIEKQLQDLRVRISDLAQEIDTYRAKTAAALGGGVFLFLLALVAAYDIFMGKTGLWTAVGATQESVYWIGAGLAVASLALLGLAIMRERRRDREREAQLRRLEQEFARLLEARDTLSQGESWRPQ